MKVWLLTSEYNDYDQHGEYFKEVFLSKPTSNQLVELCGISVATATHVLTKGGRLNSAEVWYFLREHEVKQ